MLSELQVALRDDLVSTPDEQLVWPTEKPGHAVAAVAIKESRTTERDDFMVVLWKEKLLSARTVDDPTKERKGKQRSILCLA